MWRQALPLRLLLACVTDSHSVRTRAFMEWAGGRSEMYDTVMMMQSTLLLLTTMVVKWNHVSSFSFMLHVSAIVPYF
jgi:hypothetical protein